MGMLDLFRNWLDHKRGQFRPRHRTGYLGIESLEVRRVLSPVLVGTTLTIDGTAAADTIALTQDAAGVKVVLNGVETTYDATTIINTVNIFGFGNDDQITINRVFESTALTIDGGTGNDTLISPLIANNWQITGPNSGTLNGDAFSNVENLVGSGLIDNFRFGPAGFVSGNVDGAAGVNSIDYSGRTTGVVVDLSTGKGTAIGGQFANITNFFGSTDNTDMLTGSNTANNWQITSGNAGNINLQNFFSGFESLKGGSVDDTFNFGVAGFVSRNLIGGGGTNTIDYSLRSNGVVTNLQVNASTAIGGTFSQIGSIVGTSSGTDTLTGINNTNRWEITAKNAGSVVSVFSTMNFAGYENLIGGTVSDTFKFSGAGFINGRVNGGLGFNTLDYSPRTDGIVLNLQTSSATAIGGGYLLIQNLIGSSSELSTHFDTLIGANLNTDWNITSANAGNLNGTFFFSSIENLSGGKLNDIFRLLPVGFVSGVVNAGLGTNTLDYSSRNNGVLVSLQSNLNPVVNVYTSAASAIGGGYAYISNLIGTSDLDTLVGANSTTTNNNWMVTDRNTGNVNGNFNFSGIENLKGGQGVDVFRMMDQNSLITGSIDGTNGPDWLDYSSYLTQVTVNLSVGIATNIGQAVNIRNVHGGHAVNSLTGNSRGNVLVGGEAADTIIAGPGRSLIIGGAGADTVTGFAAEDIVIGGFTVYDQDLATLWSILAEWQSPNTFQQRVSYLRNGGGTEGLNKNNKLIADVTVLNDASPDVITGGAGPNWLWGQPAEFTDLTVQDLSDTPINNPPILTGSSSLIYTTKQAATPVNTVITVTDIDSTALVSATIRVGNNYISGQDALGFVPSNATGNITGSFNAATGILTLISPNGTATLAQFQAALRSVAYWNSSTTPVTTPRTIVYQVFDGIAYSNSVSSMVYFNSAPVIAGSSLINYSAFQAPTPINTGITVTDANNVNLASATVRLSNLFFAGQDYLGFVGDATTGNITGSYSAQTGVLTLSAGSGGATVANFQAALRLVTYYNVSSNPSLFNRTVTFQVFDGAALSNTINSTIVVS